MKRVILFAVVGLVLAVAPSFAVETEGLAADQSEQELASPAVDAVVADDREIVEAARDEEIAWIGEFDVRELSANSCNCRDLCSNDLICILLNGPGSQCVPVGPCGCKECTASQ